MSERSQYEGITIEITIKHIHFINISIFPTEAPFNSSTEETNVIIVINNNNNKCNWCYYMPVLAHSILTISSF